MNIPTDREANQLANLRQWGLEWAADKLESLRAAKEATEAERDAALSLCREGADLLSVEVDALKAGISIGEEMRPGPEDAHTVEAIKEIEEWIARVAQLTTHKDN